MGQKRPRKADQRRRDPHVYIPKGRRYYYFGGTFESRRTRIRLSGTTGIREDETEARQRANEKLADLIQSLDGGDGRPAAFFATAANRFVGTGVGKTDQRAALELAEHFGTLRLSEISGEMIEAFYESRFPHHAPETIFRHQTTLRRIFSLAKTPPPDFDRPRPRNEKGKHVGDWIYETEIALLLDCCSTHFRGPVALMFGNAARVSTAALMERTDFIWRKGHVERAIFRNTKNDNSYNRIIPGWAAPYIEDALKSHNSRYAFVSHTGRPYAEYSSGGYRAYLASEMRAARDLAMKELAPDRARQMARVTCHWGRHTFANLRLMRGVDEMKVFRAGMWESFDVFRRFYASEHQNVVDETVDILDVKPQLSRNRQQAS